MISVDVAFPSFSETHWFWQVAYVLIPLLFEKLRSPAGHHGNA
jgi:hypothetical protein